jgi:PD-(D/E)XK nuclease superfamily
VTGVDGCEESRGAREIPRAGGNGGGVDGGNRKYELSQRSLRFDCQRQVPIAYKQITLTTSYRIDLIVEDLIVVEAKSVDRLLSVHDAGITNGERGHGDERFS